VGDHHFVENKPVSRYMGESGNDHMPALRVCILFAEQQRPVTVVGMEC